MRVCGEKEATFALDPDNTKWTNYDNEWFEKWVGPVVPTFSQLQHLGGYFGRLSTEGAGKRYFRYRKLHQTKVVGSVPQVVDGDTISSSN